MNKLIEVLKDLTPESKLLISIDLDYTLVDRSVSGNYVTKENNDLLDKLFFHENVFLLPNTGRELYGFNSFMSQNVKLKNGVFASGRVVRSDGVDYFNKHGLIEKNIIDKFSDLVASSLVNFVDIAYFNNREVVYKDESDLFFSQNPRDWFENGYPLSTKFGHFKSENKPVYRLEFPVFENDELFKYTSAESEILISKLIDLFGLDASFKHEYTVKRKSHYYENSYHSKFCYLRIERKSLELGKGAGILNWFNHSGYNIDDFKIIHIGDQDSGLINDTEVKITIPDSILLMVGERCNPNNDKIDIFVTKDSNKGVQIILDSILKILG